MCVNTKHEPNHAAELSSRPCCMKTTGPLPTILGNKTCQSHLSRNLQPVEGEDITIRGDHFVGLSLVSRQCDHCVLKHQHCNCATFEEADD